MQDYLSDPIDVIISDPKQKNFLEKRLNITSNYQTLSFETWCKNSCLDDTLTIELVRLFLFPNQARVTNFNSITIPNLIDYVHSSHEFYNTYYLQKLDQLEFWQHDEHSAISERLIHHIQQFAFQFRKHLAHEEETVLPYIHFLELSQYANSFPISHQFAVLEQNQNILNHQDEAEEHALFQSILTDIQQLNACSTYDFQWSFYQNLLEQFSIDLKIHEFIEDQVLFARANNLQDKLADKIAEIAVLN